MKLTEREAAFLVRYEALCREFGVFIGACGCCGSPWVTTATPQDDESARKFKESDDAIDANIKHLGAE